MTSRAAWSTVRHAALHAPIRTRYSNDGQEIFAVAGLKPIKSDNGEAFHHRSLTAAPTPPVEAAPQSGFIV